MAGQATHLQVHARAAAALQIQAGCLGEIVSQTNSSAPGASFGQQKVAMKKMHGLAAPSITQQGYKTGNVASALQGLRG